MPCIHYQYSHVILSNEVQFRCIDLLEKSSGFNIVTLKAKWGTKQDKNPLRLGHLGEVSRSLYKSKIVIRAASSFAISRFRKNCVAKI